MNDDSPTARKDQLDLLVSQLNDFVIVLANREGCFTSWHPGVERQFNYRPEEFIGQHIDLLLPAAERNTGIGERELQTAAETGRASDTRWLARKGGERILVEGVTIGLREENELVGFGKVLHDVTERKNTEDRLQTLARALDQTMVIMRQWDGTITYWTSGCERLYGWKSAEAVGKICQQLLQTAFPVRLDHIQEQLLLSGKWQGEVQHIRRDGTPLAIATHWVLLSSGAGEPLMVIETQTDVTVRSRIQRELENANEQLHRMTTELERSNEELEEFAHIASHDLSAPIISTRWLVDLLASRYVTQLSEDGQKIISQISQGLERMSNLIEGVLAHATVGTTSIGAAEPTSAEEAFDIALENLRKHIDISGAKITRQPLPDVQIAPQALAQLFQNLLSNAIKYARAGVAPVIEVSATRLEGDWLFAVRDNGIGIEQEWFERIFQPMQRRHGREIAGSGIGLATCRKIVMRAGGRIWVESQGDAGSTFLFTLPGPESRLSRPPRAIVTGPPTLP